MAGLPDRNDEPPSGVSAAAVIGMHYAAVLIPLNHLVLLTKPAEQKAEWTMARVWGGASREKGGQ